MTDFLDVLCVFVVCALIAIAYIVHLDQKVDFYRDCYNDDSYNHFDALIGDFKAIALFIVVVVIVITISIKIYFLI